MVKEEIQQRQSIQLEDAAGRRIQLEFTAVRTTCHRKPVFVKVLINDSVLVGQDGGLDGKTEVHLGFSCTVQGKSPR